MSYYVISKCITRTQGFKESGIGERHMHCRNRMTSAEIGHTNWLIDF
jgi:hypothetical protein